jgi:NAD(P)H-dependent FMN reductase
VKLSVCGMALPTLNIVISSTRPGRVGPSIARWFCDVAATRGKFKPVVVDLAEFNLPIFDEPEHPKLQKYRHGHTKAWSKSVASADAFVFVTPEYNGCPSLALLNALNYVFKEWNYKPAGFVSYGGVSAGLKAVQIQRLILNTLKMVPLVEAVMIPFVRERLGKQGEFLPTDLHLTSANTLIDELFRWSAALSTLRQAV